MVWNAGSKHVEEVDNLRLEICSSLKLSGLTVWHLSPNTLGEGDNLRLQICPSLKLGGSMVWPLNPNTLRSDLAWGLPKSQICRHRRKNLSNLNLILFICLFRFLFFLDTDPHLASVVCVSSISFLF